MKNSALIDKASACSKCGKCRSVCPTFLEETRETMVARGRVHLCMESAGRGLPPSPNLKKLISTCLLCMRCKEHCPNAVEIEEIITLSRELQNKKGNRSFIEEFLMNYIVSRKRPLGLAVRMMGLSFRGAEIARLTKLYRSLLSKTGMLDKTRLLPSFPAKRLRDLHPFCVSSPGNRRKAVYFPGCSASMSLTGVGSAVIETLVRNGTDVIIPDAGCCGMPMHAAGYPGAAERAARNNIGLLKSCGCDTIIVSCGSCGFMLDKVYKRLLGDAAHPFIIIDFSRYMLETGFRPGPHAVEMALTYHDPCHLKRGLNVSAEPRALIGGLPGVSFKEMEEADACCGCGGAFSIKYYGLSDKIRKNKLNYFQRTRARALITGCPACMIHLEDGFRKEGLSAPVLHTAEVMALTYTGKKAIL